MGYFERVIPDMGTVLTADRLAGLTERRNRAVTDPNRFENWFDVIATHAGLRAPRCVTSQLDENTALFLMDGHYGTQDTYAFGAYVRGQMQMAMARGMHGQFYLRPTGRDEPFDFRSHLVDPSMDDWTLGTCAFNVSCCHRNNEVHNTGFVLQEALPVNLKSQYPEILIHMPLFPAFRMFYDFKSHEILNIFPYHEHVRDYVHKHRELTLMDGLLQDFNSPHARADELHDYAAPLLSNVRAYPGLYGSARVWFLDFVLDDYGSFWFVNAGIGATDETLYARLLPRQRDADRRIMRDPVTHEIVELPFD